MVSLTTRAGGIKWGTGAVFATLVSYDFPIRDRICFDFDREKKKKRKN